MIVSAREILAALLADEAFSACLGEYEFDDGSREPAISLVADQQRIEGLRAVHGLEVLIPKTPTGGTDPDLTGGVVDEVTWRVYLIQYRDSGARLWDAVSRITEIAPGADYSDTGAGKISAIAGEGQVVVTIPGATTLDLSVTPDGGGDFDTGAIDPAPDHLAASSAREILDALMRDPVFSSCIGQYQFTDGALEPAISLVSDQQRIEELQDVHGLEVLISKQPRGATTPDLTGGSIDDRSWVVRLVQYRSNNETIRTAIERLAAMAPGAKYAPGGGGDGQISRIAGQEQVVFTIPGPTFLDLTETPEGGGDFDTGTGDPTPNLIDHRRAVRPARGTWAALLENLPALLQGELVVVRSSTPFLAYRDNGELVPVLGAGGGGRDMEMRATDTRIEWRLAGDTNWTSLITLAALMGPKGETGAQGPGGPFTRLAEMIDVDPTVATAPVGRVLVKGQEAWGVAQARDLLDVIDGGNW